MTTQASDTFLDRAFLQDALKALASEGFISDKHLFVSSREALQTHAAKIGAKLAGFGFVGRLRACFMRHERAGYTYVLYDDTRYRHHDQTCGAVSDWLDKSFGKKTRITLQWRSGPPSGAA